MQTQVHPSALATLAAIQSQFRHPISGDKMRRGASWIIERIGSEGFKYAVAEGVLYIGGTVCLNQMETTINNWRYENAYYLDIEKV